MSGLVADLLEAVAERLSVTAALNKRLAGVAKQYGAEIAFLVGDILLGNPNSFYLNDNIGGIAQIREDANALDKTVDVVLKEYLDAGRWYDDHPLTQDANVDALAPWVARLINQQLKAGKPDYRLLRQLAKHIQDIADWSRAERADLMKFNAKQVLHRASRWGATKKREDMAKKAPPSEMVFEHGPWKFYALTTKEALEHEGDCQRHCVGRYWDDVKSGRTKIFSVRDEKGVSKATIEVDHHYIVRQVKGPANRDVTDPSLLEAIDKFFFKSGFNTSDELDRTLYGAAELQEAADIITSEGRPS